jgi:NAD(P)-dependent dehydrogenase (short-subunit alcohol dehydrogenase family)
MDNILIIGASGCIGHEFVIQLSSLYNNANIYSISQSNIRLDNKNIIHYTVDYGNETSIENVSKLITNKLDIVIVANGILSTETITPEKSIKNLSYNNFFNILNVNSFVPAILAKYFLFKLIKSKISRFVILSARVGSISDNKLGGWHSYRMSKSALNMLIKNLSIESKRSNKNSIVIGVHPGTVDTPLSKPFQNNIDPKKIFTPFIAVKHMLNVLGSLKQSDSGKCFGWDGKEIKP